METEQLQRDKNVIGFLINPKYLIIDEIRSKTKRCQAGRTAEHPQANGAEAEQTWPLPARRVPETHHRRINECNAKQGAMEELLNKLANSENKLRMGRNSRGTYSRNKSESWKPARQISRSSSTNPTSACLRPGTVLARMKENNGTISNMEKRYFRIHSGPNKSRRTSTSTRRNCVTCKERLRTRRPKKRTKRSTRSSIRKIGKWTSS